MNETPRLWGLGALSLLLRWLEELINTLSGPLLVFGLAIALVDLLTDGALTLAAPALLFAWAISMAVGVDAQLIGSFARARHALRQQHYWTVAGYLVLGAALAYVAWVAAQVFATEQAQHITSVQALAQLGMDRTTWLFQRSGLSVFLVCLSGWTRYHPPAVTTLEDERAKLERELTLEPLRQRARAQKAVGAVGLGRQMVAAARGHELPEPPPTGPGTPSVAPVGSIPAEAVSVRAHGKPYIELVEPPEWRRARRRADAEKRVRRVMAQQPGLSAKQLAKVAHVSRSTASKYRSVLAAEQRREMAQ